MPMVSVVAYFIFPREQTFTERLVPSAGLNESLSQFANDSHVACFTLRLLAPHTHISASTNSALVQH